jgi:hypothetical protein
MKEQGNSKTREKYLSLTNTRALGLGKEIVPDGHMFIL